MPTQAQRVSLTFITGPVRSGKSRFAERLAREAPGDVTYVATARPDPGDAEWSARIAHHAARRPRHWRVVETATPGAASLEALVRGGAPDQTLLIDSLGTWLADRMACSLDPDDPDRPLDARVLELETREVTSALLATRARTIVVGEEVGWGVVPPYPSGRVFRDLLGRMQQRLAAGAGRTYLVVAGFALDLRDSGSPVDET